MDQRKFNIIIGLIVLLIIILGLLLSKEYKRDDSSPTSASYEIENNESLIQLTDDEKSVLIEDIYGFLGNPINIENMEIYSFFKNTIILKGTGEGVAGWELNTLFKISLEPLKAKLLQNRPNGRIVAEKPLSPSGRYLVYPDYMTEEEYEFRKILIYDLLEDAEKTVAKLSQEESLTEGFEVVSYLPLVEAIFTIEWVDDNTIRYNVYSAEQELVKPSSFDNVGSRGPLRPLLETRSLDIQEFME